MRWLALAFFAGVVSLSGATCLHAAGSADSRIEALARVIIETAPSLLECREILDVSAEGERILKVAGLECGQEARIQIRIEVPALIDKAPSAEEMRRAVQLALRKVSQQRRPREPEIITRGDSLDGLAEALDRAKEGAFPLLLREASAPPQGGPAVVPDWTRTAGRASRPAPVEKVFASSIAVDQVVETLREEVERIASLQGKDGIWKAEYIGSPWHAAVANIASTLVIAPGEAAEENKRVLLSLIGAQRSDGSFADYAGGPASKANTRLVSLALRVALEKNAALRSDPDGRRRLEEANKRARAFIASGARPPENAVSALMAGLLEDAVYPEERPGTTFNPLKLLDGRSTILTSLFRSLSGGHIVMLQNHALLHSPVLRPLRESLNGPLLMMLPSIAVLSEEASRDRWSTRIADQALGWLGLKDLPKKPLRDLREDILKIQDPNGGWLYAGVTTSLNMLALKKLGAPDEDPAIQRGLAFLRAQRRPMPSGGMLQSLNDGTLWDSAIAGAALLDNGVPADDPRITKTIDLILAEQQPDGRWNFATGSRHAADNDTTNMAARFLVKAYPTALSGRRAEISSALGSAVAALLKAQQRDGGWNSYRGTSWKFGARSAGMVEAAAFDASTADVTGRVMLALSAIQRSGVAGERANARIRDAHRRAVEYLKDAQGPNGWWSRWVAGYVTTGAWVVPALRAGGVRADDPMIRKERFLLMSHQNRDGGFGERSAADRDQKKARQGPSTPVQTALALTGLIAASTSDDIRQDPAIAAAVRYLLAVKKAEGWEDAGVFTFIPTMDYYASPLNTQVAVIHALKLYQDARDHGVSAALGRL